jgi:acyl carrier protein
MNQMAVIDKLQTIFDEIFIEPPTLTPEVTAKDVAEWDSLVQVSLVLSVARAFPVRFRVGEVEATKNVGEFAQLIARRMTEK